MARCWVLRERAGACCFTDAGLLVLVRTRGVCVGGGGLVCARTARHRPLCGRVWVGSPVA